MHRHEVGIDRVGRRVKENNDACFPLCSCWFSLCILNPFTWKCSHLCHHISKTKQLSVTFDFRHCLMHYPSVTRMLVYSLNITSIQPQVPSLWVVVIVGFVSNSHLPGKTAPLFIWLPQKIALWHSAFVMIVLFSAAICAQWVILIFRWASLKCIFCIILQQKDLCGADVWVPFLVDVYIKCVK